MSKGHGTGRTGKGGKSKGGAGNYERASKRAETYFRASPERLRQVQSYTGSGYDRLNKMAIFGLSSTVERLGKAEALRTLERARALQLTLRGAPKVAATVYRGMDLPQGMIDELVSRGEFTAKNFFSTSISKGRAFSGNVKMTIRQHSGVPVEKVSSVSGEREVLLPAGTRYRVTSVRKVGRTYHIAMKEMRR